MVAVEGGGVPTFASPAAAEPYAHTRGPNVLLQLTQVHGVGLGSAVPFQAVPRRRQPAGAVIGRCVVRRSQRSAMSGAHGCVPHLTRTCAPPMQLGGSRQDRCASLPPPGRPAACGCSAEVREGHGCDGTHTRGAWAAAPNTVRRGPPACMLHARSSCPQVFWMVLIVGDGSDSWAAGVSSQSITN